MKGPETGPPTCKRTEGEPPGAGTTGETREPAIFKKNVKRSMKGGNNKDGQGIIANRENRNRGGGGRSVERQQWAQGKKRQVNLKGM